ncbi:hypothetical protein ACI8AF_15760 [Blastococcus sp. SYSU D00669]
MHIRACTRRPVVCLPSARRRPAGRGLPRWVHPFRQATVDRTDASDDPPEAR